MIRVIIIEDDPMVADLAAGYLEGIDGFSLEHTAHSGEEGLALLRAHHVDLVLLDARTLAELLRDAPLLALLPARTGRYSTTCSPTLKAELADTSFQLATSATLTR